MPVTVCFRPPDTFLVQATGIVTYKEVHEGIEEILGFPLGGASSRVLVDARGVTSAPSATELRRIAGDMSPLIERGLGPMAIVSDGFVYGVARMFSVFAEVFGLSVRVFREMEEAQGWLRSPA